MSAVSPIASITARIAAIESRIGVRRPTSPSSSSQAGSAAWAGAAAASGLTGSSAPATVVPVSQGVGVSTLPVSNVPYAAEFNAAATAHDVPARLLAAVAYVESRFDTSAVSPAGAVGLMQFMPATAAGMGVDPYNPRSAIDGAARYLRSNFERFGSWDMAVAAYNVGPSAIAKQGSLSPGTQASTYLSSVLTAVGDIS